MLTTIEESRRADFRACPILEDYLATMLQDLQLSEADEACTEGREERDTGTIYTLPEEAYQASRRDVVAFYAANRADIEAAGELVPGEEGLRYGRHYMTPERVGSTLWLARSGSGVSFVDDATPGEPGCLSRLDAAAAGMTRAEPYLGDDGRVYIVGEERVAA